LIFREASGFDRGNLSLPLIHLIPALDKHFVEGIPSGSLNVEVVVEVVLGMASAARCTHFDK